MRTLSSLFVLGSTLVSSTIAGKYDSIDHLTSQYMQNDTFPGSQLSVFSSNQIYYQNTYGNLTYPRQMFNEPVTVDSVYDIASLTKVVSTTSAVMKLYEEGRIKLDDTLSHWMPEATSHGKGTITIKNLLLHNSGLPADYPFETLGQNVNRKNFLKWLYNCELEYHTGKQFIYSDLSMVFLAEIVQKITSMPLNEYVSQAIFKPMGMKKTTYVPPLIMQSENMCAATTVDIWWRDELLRCIVHDPTAYIFGGISGNAGIFSNHQDLTILTQMMLNKGLHIEGDKEVRVFKESTVELFTTVEKGLPYPNSRALGWDTNPGGVPCPCGQRFGANVFGHTGYTGTTLWADKDKNIGIVSLTNRVYPNDNANSKWGIRFYRNNLFNQLVDIVESEKKHEQESFLYLPN